MLSARGSKDQVMAAKETVSSSFARAWRCLQKTGVAGQIVSLVIVVSIFTIGTRGKYLSWDNLQVILSIAGIPAILAVGLHQTIVLGGIDFSVEGVAGLCIVFVGLLLKNKFNTNDIGLWIIPVVMGAGGIAGLLNGLVITRLRIPSFISTLGLSWILAGIAVYINKATTVPLLDTQIQRIVNGSFLGIPLIALIALGLTLVMQLSRTGPVSEGMSMPLAATSSSPSRLVCM